MVFDRGDAVCCCPCRDRVKNVRESCCRKLLCSKSNAATAPGNQRQTWCGKQVWESWRRRHSTIPQWNYHRCQKNLKQSWLPAFRKKKSKTQTVQQNAFQSDKTRQDANFRGNLLFFIAADNTKTKKSLNFLSPVGFFPKEVGTRLRQTFCVFLDLSSLSTRLLSEGHCTVVTFHGMGESTGHYNAVVMESPTPLQPVQTSPSQSTAMLPLPK